MSDYELYLGDCLVEMGKIASDSVDACVTDPPYELNFMGAKWDGTGIAYSVAMWKEVFRVLRPGAHLLSFGGTRTYHRMACAIEDAGFENRDMIGWLYSSGMPKSLNISKAIDAMAGAEREVIGRWNKPGRGKRSKEQRYGLTNDCGDITASATDAAKQWDGWGTNLAPSFEPICVARKPIACPTIAENVLKYGTGAINIDACRIGLTGENLARNNAPDENGWKNSSGGKNTAAIREEQGLPPQGRWPKNIIIENSDEVLNAFAKYGESKSAQRTGHRSGENAGRLGAFTGQDGVTMGHNDTGTAARFFYSAKASQAERNENGENTHSTVKPIALCEYLVKLVTPPGGLVLDPFMGSGSTGVAAGRNKFNFVGIEIGSIFFEIAQKRIDDAFRAGVGLSKKIIGKSGDTVNLPLFSFDNE